MVIPCPHPTAHAVSRDTLRWCLLLVVLLCLLGCGKDGAETSAPASSAGANAALTQPKINIEHYRRQLETVASDEMAGRGPGAAGEKRFVPYLVNALKQLGLQPGPNGEYTQAVPMVEIRSEVTQPLSLQRETQSKALRPQEDFVAASRRLQSEIQISDAEAVFVGYGVVAPEHGWNDYEGIDVRGKVVIMLINDPGFHQNDPSLFKGRAMTYYGRWTYKYEEAARQGAIGAFIIHDDAGAAYGWEVVKSGFSGTNFDLDTHSEAGEAVTEQPAKPEGPIAVQGWLSDAATRELFVGNGMDLDQLRAEAGQRGFRARPLAEKLSVGLTQRIRKGTSDNVVGVLPGTTRADEWLIYTAHWDHLGQSFGLPDGIYNGAIDNGTGVAGLLELARAHSAHGKRDRSILFLFVTLEESGLLGSRHYAENPLYPLASTVAVINMDAMSILGPARDMIVVGAGNSELEHWFERALKDQGRVLRPEATPETGSFYRSDHFNFAKAGVPALYPKSGIDLLAGGTEAGLAASQIYTKNDYHKPSDQFRADWNFAGIEQDLAAVAAMVEALANSDAWPNWHTDSEFRAAREAQRSASRP